MAVPEAEVAEKAPTLRVRVVDNSKEGHPVVNIRIPVRVVKFGMQMAKMFSPQMKDVNLDWDAITAMVEAGQLGKIVEVEDESENKTIEVWVE